MKADGSVSGLPRLSQLGDIDTETATIQFCGMPAASREAGQDRLAPAVNWACSLRRTQLFSTQRLHRIDRRSPVRRDQAGQQC